MNQALRLVLTVALIFGVFVAPDVTSARISDLANTQMDAAKGFDQTCGGCDPAGFDDSTACEGVCPIPCGSSVTTGIVTRSPLARIFISFGDIDPVAEPLIPPGTSPALDPFPPKLPV